MTLVDYYNITLKAGIVISFLLEKEVYDSVDGLICFYDAYKKEHTCLHYFFMRYVPKIRKNHLTCVGMAIELIRKWHSLDDKYPEFAKSCMLVSCEQEIEDINKYVSYGSPEFMPKVDKEHVLVAVNVKIDGRAGVLLADPGFHVPQVVTVMLDEAYPHSGCIVHSDLEGTRQEYTYKYNSRNPNYVEWHDKKITGDVTNQDTSLIYVAKPFTQGLNVTIRRNLVYEFKTIIARDGKGQIKAGVYFRVRKNEKQFTILTGGENQRKKTKYDFALFAEGQVLPEDVKEVIDRTNALLNFKEGKLESILRKIAIILKDEKFLTEMHDINEHIEKYSPMQPEELKVIQEVEEFEESIEVEESEELERSKEPEEAEELQKSEGLQKPEELQKAEEPQKAEELQKSEELEESEKFDDSEQLEESEKFDDSEQLEESEEFDDSEQLEESEEFHDSEQLEESEEPEKPGEPAAPEEPEKLEKPEEFEKAEE